MGLVIGNSIVAGQGCVDPKDNATARWSLRCWFVVAAGFYIDMVYINFNQKEKEEGRRKKVEQEAIVTSSER